MLSYRTRSLVKSVAVAAVLIVAAGFVAVQTGLVADTLPHGVLFGH